MPEEGTNDRFLTVLTDFIALDLLNATWLQVCWSLLTFCRLYAPQAGEWPQLAPHEPADSICAVSAAVQAHLNDDPDSAFASQTALRNLQELAEDLLELVRPTVHEMAAVIVANGMAQAIDARHGETFLEQFRSRVEVPLLPNGAYPVQRHSPIAWLGAHKPNSRPENLPTRTLDATPRLRLARSTAHDYNFVLDFDMWNRLAPLGNTELPLRIATLQPTLSLVEYDITHNDGPPRTFTNHGPANSLLQRAVIPEQIGRARDLGARIVLLPEYSLTADDRDALLRAVEFASTRPVLIVAGTCSESDDPPKSVRNEAWLLAGSATGTSYGRVLSPKLFPASIDDAEENIVRGHEVRVFMTQAWTFAVLTCRDAMTTEIIDQLADIGVNLLLVPAMTQRSGSLIDIANRLCATSQAFVVVAVAPANWSTSPTAKRGEGDRVEASFAGPYESAPRAVEAPSDAALPDVNARGFWRFDFSTRALSWHATPS